MDVYYYSWSPENTKDLTSRIRPPKILFSGGYLRPGSANCPFLYIDSERHLGNTVLMYSDG